MQSWGAGLADSPGFVWRRACAADAGSRVVPGWCSPNPLSDAGLLRPPTSTGNSKRWRRWLIFDLGKLGFVDWAGGQPSVSGSIPLIGDIPTTGIAIKVVSYR